MKQLIFTLLLVAGTCTAQNFQINDTIVLNRQQAEAIFLEKNIALIAGRLDIDIAEAQVMQAKLWPNPTLTVSEINLWSNATAEKLPPLWGNFGTTSEVAVSLEQLVITAGKRRKMIAMEKVAADMAKEYFAELLRNLKIEFRNSLTELQYIQFQQELYNRQLSSMEVLINAYQRQVQQGNTGNAEYMRLKASELQFIKELNDLNKESNRLQKELKILMNLPSASYIKLTDDGYLPDTGTVSGLSIAALTDYALQNRPDMKAARLVNLYSSEKYKFEKALRTPDVTLQASYDRGGNIMHNFVGVGFAVDIPFFNRNQGNIKAAKAAVRQSELMAEEKAVTVQSEVLEAYSNLMVAKKLYEGIKDDYESDLDKLLDNYFRNFRQKNTSLIQYIDYLNAYLENKSIILNAKKEINAYYEELKYITGQEL